MSFPPVVSYKESIADLERYIGSFWVQIFYSNYFTRLLYIVKREFKVWIIVLVSQGRLQIKDIILPGKTLFPGI